MKPFIILFLSYVLFGNAQNNSKPNIVLLMADDVSPHEFPSYGESNASTPTLNKFAKQGVQFHTAWATPKCQPTRALLMTGKYAYQTEWYHSNMRPIKGANNWALYDHELLSNITKNTGYSSVMIGKYQLNGNVTNHGFDEYFITGQSKGPDGYGKMIKGKKGKGKPSCYWNPYVATYTSKQQKAIWIQTSKDDYGPEMELNYSLDFIDRNSKLKKPLFIYLPVHLGNKNSSQNFPAPPVYGKSGKRTGELQPATMQSHVEYIDYMLTRIEHKFREINQLENTIFIVTTDNGSAGFGKDDVREQKGSRVPLIVYGGNIKKRGITSELTDLSDIFPTIADICDAQVSDVDGKSLWPFLTGKTDKHRDWIYSNLTIYHMARTKNLICDGEGVFWQVMNIGKGETLKKLDIVPKTLLEDKEIIESVLKKYPVPSANDPMYVAYLNKKKGELTTEKKPKKVKDTKKSKNK